MNMDFIENGGVTSPLGFQAAGVCAGLKRSHAPDMAMIWSEAPCSFSGTFTSNLFPAAPVQLCRERVLKQKKIQAVVINSGVANACTGIEGYSNAEKMAALTARELKIDPGMVMVSSTGRIGNQLPMDIIENRSFLRRRRPEGHDRRHVQGSGNDRAEDEGAACDHALLYYYRLRDLQ